MKKIIVIIVLLLSICSLRGQYYTTGVDRASVKWRLIETDKFQLVYPDYIEKEVIRLSRLLQEIAAKEGQNFSHKADKIPIVFHAETAKSNGYVVWAPRRSELYTTPPSKNIQYNWLTHLVTHEYRHVLQMDKLNQSTTKALGVIFGEQIVPVVLGLNIPKWFLEGDAVLAETIFSKSGRGRSGEFLQVMKAYLSQNKKWYNYDKATLGSYKDFVPGIYHLGYSLVANTCKNYGSKSWANAIEDIARKPYSIGGFGKHIPTVLKRDFILKNIANELDSVERIHRKTSTFDIDKLREQWNENKHVNSIKTLYNDNLIELQARWRQERALLDTTIYKVLSPKKKYYTNYTEPHLLADGKVVAVKSGINTYEQFIIISQGKEEHLYTPGNISGGVRVVGDLLFWTESVPHVRWEEVSQNTIYYLDLKTKKKKRLKSPYNLFTPSYDTTNGNVVAVSKNKDYTQDLMIFEIKTGKSIFKHKFKGKNIIDPVFLDDSHVAYLFANEGMGLEVLDIKTNEIEQYFFYPNVNVSDFLIKQNSVVFIADFNGKNDYYKLTLSDKKLQKITETSFGGVQAVLDKDRLIYSNYTPMGYNIVEMSMKDALMKNVVNTQYQENILVKELKKEDNIKESMATEEQPIFPVSSKPYRKSAHLINIHSWAPMAVNPSGQTVDWGVSIQSQNLLSTMFFNGGYRLKNGHKYGKAFANISYRGWFPVLSSSFIYGKERDLYYGEVKMSGKVDTLLLSERRKQMIWKNRISLPLNLSRGKYYRGLIISADYKLRKDYDIVKDIYNSNQEIDRQKSRQSEVFSYTIAFSNRHKMAFRDLQTGFGQVFIGKFTHNPFDKTENYSYSLEGTLYLPSLFNHHGLRLYGGYQYFHGRNRLFSLDLHSARGINSAIGTDNYSFSADYSFPLAYPEWNLSGIAYFKRFKTNLFCDIVGAKFNKYSFRSMSYGVEFRSDTHFFRLPVPVNIGFRIGYEDRYKRYFSNFLFSIAI